jgi:parvulin-like peptidyl-prolyl isomerase
MTIYRSTLVFNDARPAGGPAIQVSAVMKSLSRRITPYVLAAWLALPGVAGAAGAADAAPAPADSQPVFARVGDTAIGFQEYENALAVAARNKFYHGKPPEGEVALLQREVGEQVVARVLLLGEARRRGLEPDAAAVQKTLREYEQRYGGSEQWKASRERVLPGLTRRLEEDSLMSRIEKLAREAPAPDDQAVQVYYAGHPDKFTEPEQLRVSAILLRVDPGAAQAAWDKAYEEAIDIVKRLRGGADFATLARIHSGDASAGQGGDMGYLHHGMLPEGPQAVMDKAQPGEISEPVRVLEGIAVLRLEDRKAARLSGFETVRERARELLRRELGEQALKDLVARLKQETPIQVDESRYLPLPLPPALIAPEKDAPAAGGGTGK